LPEVEASRTESVQHRVVVAKAALAIAAFAAFGGAVALSRLHHPSRPKQPLRPLGVSRSYAARVHKSIGNSGAIQPPLGSPSAATHVS
jgi:hypothetical protein